MEFVIIGTYILLLFLIWMKVRDKISRRIMFVYLSYWFVSLLLCKINPFEYYKISDNTYLLLIMHLVTFVLGFVLYSPSKVVKSFKEVRFDVLGLLRNRLFLLIYLICTVFVSVLFYRQRMLLALYTLGEMRGDFMDMILEGSGVAYLFYHTIATGMYHFCLCLIAYMFLFERKWSYIIFLFLYTTVWTLLSGGRAQIITFGYYGVSMLIIADYIQSIKNGCNSKYVLSAKAKIFVVFIVVGMFAAMSVVTFMKHSTGKIDKETISEGFNDLVMDLGEYSAGPIVAFDIGMNDRGIMTREFQYGAATFSGLDYFLYMGLRKFGIHTTTSYDITTHILQSEHRNISPDRGWNYAYTSCMYYYYDFGVWGVLLFPFILGLFTRKLISRLYISTDIYNIAIFTFVCFCMYMSVFSGYLMKMITPFYIIVMLFLSRSSKNKVKTVCNRKIHY